jgi:hypothetical protein
MRLVLALIVILMASACTTLRPVELSADQLQDRIPAGEVIQVGDSVVLTTSDDKQHKFVVTSITTEAVIGKDIEVPIENIVAAGKREPSTVKSLSLIAGVAIVVAIAASGDAGYIGT